MTPAPEPPFDIPPIVTYAVPFFVLTIIVEMIWVRVTKKGRYQMADSASSLAMGLGNQVVGTLFGGAIQLGAYLWAYEHRIFTLDWSWPVLVACFFGEDLAYYWFHRMSHRSRWLWAIHVSHHSSELMNFSTALRQPPLEHLIDWLWFVGLSWLGIPAKTILLMYGLNLTYQFFIHTELVYKLPRWLEFVLNTPSHHRVHHGKNAEYIDMNYGGVFIIWDRLFGSFIEEDAPVEYGILKPIHSYNPFYVGFHLWADIWRDLQMPSSLWIKFKQIFAPPGWAETYRATHPASLQK